jgi:tRNA modification GTPase
LETTAKNSLNDTIVALATGLSGGAIAIIRVSGSDALAIVEKIFKGKKLSQAQGHTAHFGLIHHEGLSIDEVVCTIYKNPKSYTGQDLVEISCHASRYIVNKIITTLIKLGCRYANAGEFTLRAFLNGKIDLAQAEAVADMIAVDSEASHKAAISQMRGGFSNEISKLRQELLNFASLIELELDFSEEDVEFADRKQLTHLVNGIKRAVDLLIDSFSLGNVIKNGVPTVIVGKPNAGKSTLLNALLNEDKAMVSDIEGTTRDFIEDEIAIEGVIFRFIDTAGLRHTTDKLEALGIERTKQQMKKARLIIYLFDVNTTTEKELIEAIDELKSSNANYLIVGNKIDTTSKKIHAFKNFDGIIFISAAHKAGLEELKSKLLEAVNYHALQDGDSVVTNVRHLENLSATSESLAKVLLAIEEKIASDFLAQDIRAALYYLGQITGEITNDELLGNIFSKFCIGK